jgi:uncharacterized membrane protein
MKVDELEYRISLFLRRGVFTATFLLAVGFLGQIFFPHTEQSLGIYQKFEGIPFAIRLQTAIFENNWFSLFSCAGLVALISLPIIRVALTGFLFWRNNEKAMSLMALAVFFMLILSLCLGIDFN